MATLPLTPEWHRACEGDTADRFMQLWRVGMQGPVLFDAVKLGRRSNQSGLTVSAALETFSKDTSLAIVGYSVLQLCHRRKHESGPQTIEGSDHRLELKRAIVFHAGKNPEELAYVEGQYRFDDDGVGSATVGSPSKRIRAFDPVGKHYDDFPVTGMVEAHHPYRGYRVAAALHNGLTKLVSPDLLDASIVFGTDI